MAGDVRAIPDSPQSVTEAVNLAARDHPDNELVGRSGRLSWPEVEGASHLLAAGLTESGVGPGDRVACSLPNDLHVVIALLSVLRAGAVWVGINGALAAPEKQYVLDESGARLLIAEDDTVASVDRSALPSLGPDDIEALWSAGGDTLRTYEAPPVDPFGPAAIAYTSGTTGRPKGVVHSQRNLVLPCAVMRHRWGDNAPRRVGQCLPLTILNVMILGPVMALVTEATFVAMDRADADGIASWVQEEGIETFNCAPPTARDLITRDEIDPADLASLRRATTGGAVFPTWYRDAFKAKFGAPLASSYGTTEAPTSVTLEPFDRPPPPGSFGRPAPQVEITIRDDQDNELPTGEVGEICVTPATDGRYAGVYTPMLGYWQNEEATEVVLVDGVYHTGDMGSVDEDGWVYVNDRRRDMISRGGANVYPAEIERVLAEHRDVTACAVFGRAHDRLGEEVIAVYQPAQDKEVAPDDLVELCRTNLAAYKVPAAFYPVAEMPRNPMGKISKPALLELFGKRP